MARLDCGPQRRSYVSKAYRTSQGASPLEQLAGSFQSARQQLGLGVAQVLRQNQILAALFDGNQPYSESGLVSRVSLAESLGDIGLEGK